MLNKDIIILGIESSCDDTGIAVLEVSDKKSANFKVLANKVASQIKVHKKYGGVFPIMAKREHQKNIVPTFIEAIKEANLLKLEKTNSIINATVKLSKKIKTLETILDREPELAKRLIPFLKKYSKPNFDFIAVTSGPGLEPCLWVGINFARALSFFWDIPIIPINHIEGHILINFLEEFNKIKNQKSKIKNLFPAISLIVSGGHTQLILIKNIGSYKILGETRDDAAGECFDKAAKILRLGYPGGPAIAKIVSQLKSQIPTESRKSLTRVGTNYKFQIPKLPRPMYNDKTFDFSFSGLKTAILYSHRKQPKKIQKSKRYIKEMCNEIQQAIIDVLLKKTLKATKDFGARSIILGGGVSANDELRTQFIQRIKKTKNDSQTINFLVPPANLSTDNGLMIAISGYYNINKKIRWQDLSANSNLRIDTDN